MDSCWPEPPWKAHRPPTRHRSAREVSEPKANRVRTPQGQPAGTIGPTFTDADPAVRPDPGGRHRLNPAPTRLKEKAYRRRVSGVCVGYEVALPGLGAAVAWDPVSVVQGRPPSEQIEYRLLGRAELARVGEIDRTEQIDTLYVQDGGSLREVQGQFSAAAWSSEGHGEYSVAHQRDECERLADAGGATFGAFEGHRLVGLGIVLPHLRPDVAQLAYLYVSDGFRGRGIGAALTEELERIAREAGDRSIVVSAVPSQNTVDFYRGRGYEPMVEPLPELYELEPDDVHLEKTWR